MPESRRKTSRIIDVERELMPGGNDVPLVVLAKPLETVPCLEGGPRRRQEDLLPKGATEQRVDDVFGCMVLASKG